MRMSTSLESKLERPHETEEKERGVGRIREGYFVRGPTGFYETLKPNRRLRLTLSAIYYFVCIPPALRDPNPGGDFG